MGTAGQSVPCVSHAGASCMHSMQARQWRPPPRPQWRRGTGPTCALGLLRNCSGGAGPWLCRGGLGEAGLGKEPAREDGQRLLCGRAPGLPSYALRASPWCSLRAQTMAGTRKRVHVLSVHQRASGHSSLAHHAACSACSCVSCTSSASWAAVSCCSGPTAAGSKAGGPRGASSAFIAPRTGAAWRWEGRHAATDCKPMPVASSSWRWPRRACRGRADPLQAATTAAPARPCRPQRHQCPRNRWGKPGPAQQNPGGRSIQRPPGAPARAAAYHPSRYRQPGKGLCARGG